MPGRLPLLRNTDAGIRRCRCQSSGNPRSWQLHGTARCHAARYSQQAAREASEDEVPEKGAMSRKLEEMAEESLENSPRRARQIVDEAGFSTDLKKRLEERIAAGSVATTHPQAASVVSMPPAAGRGTRDMAEAQPWTGTERLEDAALRMLDDAHRPLRGANARGRKPAAMPPPVDMRRKQSPRSSSAERLANARDKTSMYSLSQDENMTAAEKDEMRRILKERFQPSARPIPATIQGLQSLASERIEDAIARGLFKNIPRGKGVNVERDHRADSPFIDTTEYFMNKIIQKQEVLPPWVEKQQEVTRTITTFRARLRADWTRHAARVIASRGGTLQQQVRRAERYALAEARHRKQRTDATPPSVSENPPQSPDADSASSTPADATTTTTTSSAPAEPILGPFRDPAWEAAELSYHTLALTQLNSLTRSYNLMAPELAKKPYFSLARELQNCYADVAPLLPEAIRARAVAAPARLAAGAEQHRVGGVLERFGQGERVRVWESRRPQYGFREFWRDLWQGKT